MTYAIRKVALSKWQNTTNLQSSEIPSYAVSTDLKAEDNAISFWRCDSSPDAGDWESRLTDAALAIAGGLEQFDTICVVWLPILGISDAGLNIRASQGRTTIADLVNTHIDVVSLDLDRFCKLARLIGTCIRQSHFQRLTKSTVKSLVREAVAQQRVQLESLADKMQIALRDERR